MTARTLRHITVSTGHERQSGRAEVSDDVIAGLAPLAELLTASERWQRALIPGVAGYTVEGRRTGTDAGSAWRVRDGLGRVIVTFDVDANPAAFALRVYLWPALADNPDAAQWIGDFERCMAWAILHVRAPADDCP